MSTIQKRLLIIKSHTGAHRAIKGLDRRNGGNRGDFQKNTQRNYGKRLTQHFYRNYRPLQKRKKVKHYYGKKKGQKSSPFRQKKVRQSWLPFRHNNNKLSLFAKKLEKKISILKTIFLVKKNFFFYTNKMEERLKQVEECQKEKHIEETYNEGVERGRRSLIEEAFVFVWGICTLITPLIMLANLYKKNVIVKIEEGNPNNTTTITEIHK